MKYPYITFLDLGSNYENILSILFTQHIWVELKYGFKGLKLIYLLCYKRSLIYIGLSSVNLLVLDVEGLMIRSYVHLKIHDF